MSRPICRRGTLPLHLWVLAVALLGLTACDRGRDGAERGEELAAVPALAPLPPRFDGTWQGVLPCVDCDGVGTVLHLRRDAGAATFVLRERYFGSITGDEYASEGGWSELPCTLAGEPGLCIVLEGLGLRWYRRGDGSLQGIGADGGALDGDGVGLQRQ